MSPYCSAPKKIDGNISDWEGAEFKTVTPRNGTFDAETGSTSDQNDIRYKFSVANDEKYLYAVVVIHDDKIVIDNCRNPKDKNACCWMDDAVEFFIDGNHNRAPDARDLKGNEKKTGGEFSITANGATTSFYSGYPKTFGNPEYWTGASSYSRNPTKAYKSPWDCKTKTYVIEAMFHLKNITGRDFKNGGTIGFTIGVQDDDNGNEREYALYWQGRSPSCWKDEGAWGNVVLSGKP